jgi:hypothetical protein
MRPIIASTVLFLAISGTVFAQEWVECASREDRFTCNFPGQPKVADIVWRSEHGADLPARSYSSSQGKSSYIVTVVDYNQVQRILTEKSKSCPPGAETCRGNPGDEGHWKADLRGAAIYASWQLMRRDAKLTSFIWGNMDQVEGLQMQLTNNADKSRTFAGIYLHENKLYIIEGTVPAGYPEPGLFHQSLGWLDADGIGLRYQSYYSNYYPAPPRVDRNTNPGQGRIDLASPGSGSTAVVH